ncbi:single-stranded DNA-binding protein [Polynucleobacter sp. Fuers-14]|uniref:single-stranded DNA-binding protein n=1 Tax=Polynucleobacter sp. Fuers-14 TaxID=1758364 RepID=UPI001C0AF43A|nr:single-stranded DNA-binding protein [Polynucleobacter sp. Fuers-14]MBU3640975.1 single-stranded DNA-binding protein [Polynucleobacter sp. Fuers-14]
MAISAEIKGNLLQDPEQRLVQVKGEGRKITELRVWADVYKKEGDSLIQDEDKSEPVNVTIWQEHLGEDAMRLLSKGMRVVVKGALHIQTWQDKENQSNKYQVHVEAESVSLALNRVEEIKMRQKEVNA